MERRRLEEEEEAQRRHVKELERQSRAASSKTSNVLELLTQGGYAFDSAGKPLLVRKVNPMRLPEMVPEMDIDVEGYAISKTFEAASDLAEAPGLSR